MAIGGSGKGIQIVVGTEYKDKDLKRAQRDLDKLKGDAAKSAGPFQKLGASIKNNLGPALAAAGIAAGALAVKLGVDGVKAAIEDQKTVEVLAQTLENLGKAHEQAGVEEFVAGLESAYGVTDERLRPALGKLLIATNDVGDAQRRLQQAMDISVGTGRDLEGVVQAMARAVATGSKGPLSRFGIILDDNTIKTQGFGAALDEAAGKFAGIADREAKTLEGRLRILAVEFDNVKEAFGYGFLDGVGDAGDGVSDMTELMRELQPVARDLGEQIGLLAKFFGDLERETGVVTAVLKGFLDLTGPLFDAILYFYRVIGQGEDPVDAFKSQFLGLNDAGERVAYTSGTVAAAIAEGERATKDAIKPTQDLTSSLEEEAAAAEKAAEEFDKLAGAIKNTNAIMSYQSSIDKLKKTIEETGGKTSIFTEEGRKSVDAYVDLVKSAGDYIQTLESQSDQASTAQDVLNTLRTQMGKTKMDPATQAALLAPFQALIDDLREAGVDVSALQRDLDRLKSKTVRVTVVTKSSYIGTPPPGGYEFRATGGLITGSKALGRGTDTVPAMLTPGEFVMRRQAVKQFGADLFSQLNRGVNPLAGMTPTRGNSGGLTINGGITVQAAAGERAEESLPRALRRMSFLAGMTNG